MGIAKVKLPHRGELPGRTDTGGNPGERSVTLMRMAWILVQQILQMFVLAGMGYLLFKTKKITAEGSKALGNILIWLSLPATIINGFLVEPTRQHLYGFVQSGIAALVLLLLSTGVSALCFRKDAIAAFAGAFSNPGFFGVPLIIASLGRESVFYVACFIALLNIGQWTYGVSLMTGRRIREGFRLKKLLTAPFMIAMIVGVILFTARVRLPAQVSACLNTVASLNTPLAMFVVGIYLAQTDLRRMFRRGSLYAVSAVRLLLIPLLSILLLTLLPPSLNGMKRSLLLVAACPVGVNVSVYAQLHGKNYPYAVETVVLSTLFSVVTIPGLALLAGALWG